MSKELLRSFEKPTGSWTSDHFAYTCPWCFEEGVINCVWAKGALDIIVKIETRKDLHDANTCSHCEKRFYPISLKGSDYNLKKYEE